ncbi:MFS transporter [Roseovarius sp. 2305UL8-3]|uniref:MFS transporter n=1 Tax=Roseovarius conchicola TaxID=3121636 RepID=UPI00352951A5
MARHDQSKARLVLAAASLLCAVLGSVHAFSVFLEPLELAFSASRSAVSFTYSLALVTLTCTVLLGPRIFARWSAARLVLVTSALAAFGTFLAGIAGSLPVIWLGYSLIFGAANGIGYGFGLQISAQVNPGREGLAMGIVTAAYALGAIVSPILFAIAVDVSGFALAMLAMSVVLIATGSISATLMHRAKAWYKSSRPAADSKPTAIRDQQLLWIGYFGAVLAGLMVLGHAAGILAVLKPGLPGWTAAVVISCTNLVGSLAGGRLADKIPLGVLLSGLAILTALSLVGLALIGPVGGVIVGLSLVGFAYGGTIAAYPAVIAKLFGTQDSARVYGRVFTAWGAAGLLGPWLAGVLFDISGTYHIALLTAAGFGLFSAGVVTLVFRRRTVGG